nr:hypothetical protein [Tanacetum cinerariifolium]
GDGEGHVVIMVTSGDDDGCGGMEIVMRWRSIGTNCSYVDKTTVFLCRSTKQALDFQNPFYLKKARQLEPKLYDGDVIKNNCAILILDLEETLVLAKESRSKMLLKQKDPMVLEKKLNTKPIDYAALNKLSKDFETRFALQTELSAEQVSCSSSDPIPSNRPTTVEVPSELPKVSMAVNQHRLESKTFDFQNERLLKQVISKDIVNIVVNASVNNASIYMYECKKCLELETELLNKKDFIEKEKYDKLLSRYTTLEKHFISLEVDTQPNQEISKRDNSISNQSAPSFNQYFELNELKAQS